MNLPTVLIYVEHPMCSLDCADAVYDVLTSTNKYDVKRVGPDSWPKEDFTSKSLQEADCIIFPGGDGDLDQFDQNVYKHTKLIKEYVHNGGRYFGICMGGYFAGEYCFNLLENFSTKQFVTREGSCVTDEGANVVEIKWKDNKTYSCYFHDGAAFVPTVENNLNYIVHGRYKNNDIAGMTVPVGKGKVTVLGPHLEAQRWWFYYHSNIKNEWKNSIQHELFLQMFDVTMSA